MIRALLAIPLLAIFAVLAACALTAAYLAQLVAGVER